MASVQQHYDRHLASVYEWMLGDPQALHRRNLQWFQTQLFRPTHSGIAIDLGAGTGAQAIPLAQLGFSVVAIDLCQPLLDQLNKHASSLPIQTVCGDLLDFETKCDTAPDLIVCMGDTLTHLDNMRQVKQLLQRAARCLTETGGWFVASFRDYSQHTSAEQDRFLLVRGDENQILTCGLREDGTHLKVTDLIHRRQQSGWTLETSSYRKLKIAPNELVDQLTSAGFANVDLSTQESMVNVVAKRSE